MEHTFSPFLLYASQSWYVFSYSVAIVSHRTQLFSPRIHSIPTHLRIDASHNRVTGSGRQCSDEEHLNSAEAGVLLCLTDCDGFGVSESQENEECDGDAGVQSVHDLGVDEVRDHGEKTAHEVGDGDDNGAHPAGV